MVFGGKAEMRDEKETERKKEKDRERIYIER